jgi:hypothetical protein
MDKHPEDKHPENIICDFSVDEVQLMKFYG